ncbi:LytR family transcriptional attenuator [Nonomuraea polychroma]|uniref:LytR family transcriptional attenuator n=1 Tax=Nonomuraea polychroma TaxID=46176 RepID=A0A438MBN2_9ACTN|nr:LCP family protein [Nonomuraea polychroma]RVX43132.1 LytR family transcriptional attenuator [Nonomuraea polychroma]
MTQGVDRVRGRPGDVVREPRVAPGPRRAGKLDPRPRRNPLTPLGWVSVALTLVLVATTLGAYAYYRSIEGAIPRLPFDPGHSRPPETGALNVLLVGSDSREGDNKQYGPKSQGLGERTDTIMLLHISPNRDKATVISFPRDSMVMVPECQGRNGAVLPGGVKQINSAFNDGGINCTVKTLESLTNIKINHFVKVDFTGFKGIIDALGGIEICLPTPVNDPKAKLVLPAGKHVVNGEQALGYVRTRYALGDGSDLSRIQRQQVFLNQVVKKVTDGGLLTNPVRLNDFLRSAAAAVTVDTGLTLDRMLEIATSVRGLTAKELKGITVPVEAYPADKNRVQFSQPAAKNFFEAVRNDDEVTATPTPGTSATPKIEHEQVRVQVLNGTGEQGKAVQVADELAAQGFAVIEVGNAPTTATTAIRYAKKDAQDGPAYAEAVAARLSKDKRTPVAGKVKPVNTQPYESKVAQLPDGPIVQLVIGADWPGVRVQSAIPDSLKDKVVDSTTNPCL